MNIIAKKIILEDILSQKKNNSPTIRNKLY